MQCLNSTSKSRSRLEVRLVDVYENEAMWVVKSQSHFNRWHEVFCNSRGWFSCSCIGSGRWQKGAYFHDLINGGGNVCVHVRAVFNDQFHRRN